MNLWGTRTTSSGKFEKAKRSGDVFGGAKREDAPHDDWLITLLFLGGLALAFGTFIYLVVVAP